MKKVLLGIIVICSLLTSCKVKDESSYEPQWNQTGDDSVVYVHYVDENNNSNSFFMNYLLFHTLFNIDGYNGVNNYYRSYPSQFSNQTGYSSYSRNNAPKTSSFYRAPSSTSNSGSSYSSPSRKSSNSGSSYSSPSRSTYSSPSRSTYSSPSRSYSSPSRSYSSPSRSYPSPSRGH